MKTLMQRFVQEESGQNMIEYILVIALVALIAVGGLTVLGPKIKEKLTELSGKLDSSTNN